ncbi:hypothetical protein MWH25_06450 [Natroniella acetigena]|uniref:hypothetical protein n=1 Tax=Natroniella acetigena TaxID=52004 RepID=UPI00200B8628|nr:hypothetical protein [Natroniella acetigena]MCK8827383.1 hypothetical protein [Natroniella acetigena]
MKFSSPKIECEQEAPLVQLQYLSASSKELSVVINYRKERLIMNQIILADGNKNERLINLIKEIEDNNKLVAAICAVPMVLE